MTAETASARPVRIGMAGAGWVTLHHLEAWARLSGRAKVVAIADPDLAAATSRATAFQIPSVYGSVDAMLEAESLDAIDVATPRETHAPICRRAAEYGLDILCQKPLAPTLAEAEALVSDLDGRVRLMVHENWRFRPHYRRIAGWLRDGQIGDVRTVRLCLLTSGLLPDADGRFPALERQPMLAGLERLLVMEVLIHHIDTLRFLLGPLTMQGATLGKSCEAVIGEDRASLLLSTAGGAAVSIVGDFAAHGHPPQQFDGLEILGTGGRITLDRHRLRLAGRISAEHTPDFPSDYKASYVGVITHFLDRLADRAPFETSGLDNLHTLRIVEAAYGERRDLRI